MLTDAMEHNPAAAASDRHCASAESYFGIELQCPRCSANLSAFLCSKCGFRMCDNRGVVHALPPERAEHFAQFIADYEYVRAAEGRGGASDEFYLGLPYRDISGRNSEQWRIRACTYGCLMERVLKPELPQGARILDLGAGNCWLSYRLSRAGFKPCAVDLLTNECDGLGAAEHFRGYLPQFFPRFQAEMTHLPFQGGQFDAVIFNASFHYTESARAALKEALRCVKWGGLVIVSDTPWYSREESGRAMLSERRSNFLRRYGTDSASIESIEYLTAEHLQHLEESLSISWTAFSPKYGFKWAMRPFVARLRGRREPARFRIYVARKAP